MPDEERGHFDRRDDKDRRRVHDLDYFEVEESEERRSFQEERKGRERRSGWVRVSRWISVFAQALGFRKKGK